MPKYIRWFKNLEVAVGKSLSSPAMILIDEGRTQLKYVGADKELVVDENGHLVEQKTDISYLCFTALEDSTVQLQQTGTPSKYKTYDLQTSTDGKTWSAYTVGDVINIAQGNKLYWKGNNTAMAESTKIYKKFVMTGKIAASGDCNSILGENVKAITDYCYCNMFYGCTSLTTAPELPAAALADDCYRDMFHGCSSLTTAPELPSRTLASCCYYNMFYGCTSLTTAPELPATTMKNSCYDSMFYKCASLTTAPELPATILADSCYFGMFCGCTKLSYIKAMFTDWSASGCLSDWVSGVASNGTFVKNAASTFGTRGESAIPKGWTIEKATA